MRSTVENSTLLQAHFIPANRDETSRGRTKLLGGLVGRRADLVTVHRRGPVKLLPRSSPQTLLANRGKRPPALTYSGVESSQTQEDMRSTSNAVLPAFWKFVSSLFVPSRNINTSSIMAHFHRQQCNQAQVENMWRCHSHWGSRYRYQPAIFSFFLF